MHTKRRGQARIIRHVSTGIESIHLNLHLKIKQHGIGYGDVFGMGGNHWKEDCEDLRKAVERGDVHIRDRWIYLGQQGVGDTVLVPTPQEIEGKMKWQKDWVHEGS